MLNEYKEDIDHIFQNYSIYKSIIVCKNSLLNKLYNILLNNDYPVVKINDINKFNEDKSRIFLIEEYDFNHIDLIKDISDLNINNINTVIICGDMELNIPEYLEHCLIFRL